MRAQAAPAKIEALPGFLAKSFGMGDLIWKFYEWKT